jgi:alpha-galactosidase
MRIISIKEHKTVARKNISIVENGIKLLFQIDEEGYIKLLHCGTHEYTDDCLTDDQKIQFRLFEVQLAGKNQGGHHGAKNYCSSEGVSAKYLSHNDYTNEFGRKLEIITFSDDVEIVSHYQFYNGIKVIRSWTDVTCLSESPIVLEYVSSFCLYGLAKENFENKYESINLHIPTNSWHSECQWRKNNLYEMGLFNANNTLTLKRAKVSNTGSWSSKEHLPMGMIEDTINKRFILWQIENNGSWHWEVSDISNQIYLAVSGPCFMENHWTKKLAKGEIFSSVKAAISFGEGKSEGLFSDMTSYRRIIRRKNDDNINIPSIYNAYMHNAWEYPGEKQNESSIIAAARCGCEYFCIDAGWHDEADYWDKIGEWKESRTRFPNGVKKQIDFIKSNGMKAGLWLEIEAVGANSAFASHWDDDCYFVRNGGRVANNNRYQLDFRNPKVIKFMDELFDRIVEDYDIDYIKIDYNQCSGPGTEINSDSLGDGLLEHGRAYLKWLEGIYRKYPELVIENCGSGGQRMDYAMLAVHSIQSTSDQVDFKKYPYISSNILSAVTPEQAAIWSYPLSCATKEEIALNMINSLLGRMHLAGEIFKLDDECISYIKEGVEYYDSMKPYKPQSVPFWPLGFSGFRDTLVCAGIKTDEKAYLAVWNLGGTRNVQIPLTDMAVSSIKVGYPTKLETDYVFENNLLKINFTEDYQARLFEIERVR